MKMQLDNTIDNKRTPSTIRLHGCYYVTNVDLGIDSFNGGHDVFVIKFSKDRKRVKVKTVTSLERRNLENGIRVFKHNKRDNNYLEAIHNGEIVVMSKKRFRH